MRCLISLTVSQGLALSLSVSRCVLHSVCVCVCLKMFKDERYKIHSEIKIK